MTTETIVGKCPTCSWKIVRTDSYWDRCAGCGRLFQNPTYVHPPMSEGDKLMAEEFAKPDRVVNGERFPRND